VRNRTRKLAESNEQLRKSQQEHHVAYRTVEFLVGENVVTQGDAVMLRGTVENLLAAQPARLLMP
jgi:hypothetical protein